MAAQVALRSLRASLALSVWTLSICGLGGAAARAAGEIAPGAYCPLPKKGEARKCLEPAREEYQGFFDSLARGAVDHQESARLEADVAGGESGKAYLALSSLSYGYYQMAQLAAAEPGIDPGVIARLERWNALLAQAYESNADDRRYREALRAAASDLYERTRVRLGCADARGEPAECDSTEAVLRGFDAASGEVGIRGALRRLLERIMGRES